MAQIRIPKNDKRTAQQIENEIKKSLKQVGIMTARRLKEPTSTWKHSVVFKVEEPVRIGDDLICRVTTEDGPYFWLDEGTSIRYATMSTNFVPKTKPRSFKSGAGQGRMKYLDKTNPKPGIKRRQWTEMVSLEMPPVMQSALDQILAGYDPRPATSGKQITKYIP